ncbi:MAG TPA: GrpB family protein [Candidatus Kapabacteria bacterium]|nr:GrpB family protein [Candidatus Kapabacteria bacterium]
MSEPVIIAEYDSSWPVIFEAERSTLLDLFSQSIAVEHIGSTSVNGLASKPIIDILLGVNALADAEAMIPIIVGLGYQYIPEYEAELPQRRYFKKVLPSGAHTHHIHLVERMGSFWRNHIYFRDRLRSDEELRRDYESLKKELAERYQFDREAYTDAKTSFIMAVVNERAAQRNRISELVEASISGGDATGWFEKLYSGANGDASQIPWADKKPNGYLVDWLDTNNIIGYGKSAVVVGCGLGDDAEELSRRGYNVTAFDVSPSAIEWAKKRFPNSNVQYQSVDLFEFPERWKQHFDLVFECYTVQALPRSVRSQAIRSVCDLVAPAGDLLVVARGWREGQSDDGPPWAITDEELKEFSRELKLIVHNEFHEVEENRRRIRCLYRRV